MATNILKNTLHQPKAKILPAESKSEEVALKVFEKKHNLAKFKEEIRQALEVLKK